MKTALLFQLGTCTVQIQSVWLNFACTKGFFNLSAEAIINARNARLCVKCAIFLFDQTNCFFLSFGQGVYSFEEGPKSIQDVIGDGYCPGKYCFNTEKCESLDSYVTTPRSHYGSGNCGACLFVHKVLMFQEHVKTTKTDKTRFFFPKKKMRLLPDKQLFINVPIQSTKNRREELCADSKVQEIIGDGYCPSCRNENCVYLSTNKTSSFYRSRKCKACTHETNIPFKVQNRQLCCLVVTVHFSLQKNES